MSCLCVEMAEMFIKTKQKNDKKKNRKIAVKSVKIHILKNGLHYISS